ncbi:hypothetical protein VTL71DRAFT_2985 [Oculimacula yallundae]|uniref:Zn(2)-C6 fungal-type domain-containing protein n=1 Tax=Oculimacula yallundae TaxID=86028 RepID=A0ABR4C6Z5_9HELO
MLKVLTYRHKCEQVMMNRGDRFAFRATQRAPRSCSSCASRKVKCDKAIPCASCIRRGEAEACARETVIVRGKVKKATDTPSLPTDDDLQSENARLAAELKSLKDRQAVGLSVFRGSGEPSPLSSSDSIEEALWSKVCPLTVTTRPTVASWNDIVLPSKACSDVLIAYDKTWNSWVHCALEYPLFIQDCDRFFETTVGGTRLEEVDHSWLSIYFSVLCTALLMMDDNSAANLTLPYDLEPQVLNRNWYDAAIFCLHQADFLRKPAIGNVQAIAILGMCFNNFGDPDLGNHMWSAAIRIGKRLNLNTGSSQLAAPLSAEGQHRLWWTLVIVEWLAAPYHPPQVDEADFNVPLPSTGVVSLEERDLDPIHYHIFMARLATVYHRFSMAVRTSLVPLGEIVRVADSQLAEIIDTLPELLQPDHTDNEIVQELELAQPWIKWQRFDITVVLLHHRIRINRTLQRHWRESPGQYSWARSVSVQSSLDIVWISRHWDQPASIRKQWALSYHIFVAALLLFRESQDSNDEEKNGYIQAIETALKLLDDVKSRNAVAHHAAVLLRGLLGSSNSNTSND